MKVTVNNNDLNIRSDFSFIQTRRKNKNHENEYIVTSYIYSDKPLLEYEKEKVSDWITARINKEEF